ncbi:MAG: transketolase [Alphaproteobacteria bacterium]
MNAVRPEPAVAPVSHREMANAIRALAMDAVQQAKSGHPGMPMGMADVATVLFTRFLKFDPAHPDWPDRDRFVMCAGHGSMLLYALLYLTGYPDMTVEELRRFRQLGSRTAGHPEHGLAAGIETTSGPLGQGFANGVGMALAERLLAARFAGELVNHFTYVLASDGSLMEGISHEASSLGGHLGLEKLIVLYDSNRVSIDGPTDLATSDDAIARYRAYGWDARAVDGQNPEAVAAAIAAARESPRPSLIACRTIIGYGAPRKEGTAATHGAPLGEEEVAGARERLGWPHPPFEVPAPVLLAWRAVGSRGASAFAAWRRAFEAAEPEVRRRFERVQRGELPEGWEAALRAHKRMLADEPAKIATRKASQGALEVLTREIPELVGGSADLTESNNTKTSSTPVVKRGDFSGRYIHYGVREHAMAAVMSGLALHGGVIPYGGSFLVFTDYCRPAIRLAALMGKRVVYVMTHDSIGLGEDGPTHQPVEHLASLRAVPNINVFRPADAIETAECWALAVATARRPSVLVLTRQTVPPVRTGHAEENLCAKGAYVLAEANGKARVTLIATGSEVAVALAASDRLEAQNVTTRVVSLPCWELFEAQSMAYRESVLGAGTLKVAVEAASPLGWERYIGSDGVFIGMRGFGASAPGAALFEHFRITPDAVVEAVTARL